MTEITQTVTFDDLIADHDDELDDLREGYDDLAEWATDEHGERREGWPEEVRQYLTQYDETAKTIQKRQHVLETLREEYDDDTFELQLLSGAALMDIETELRMEANKRGVEPAVLNSYRERLLVDRATVDAPDAVPTDDEGSPVPSECPNPLVQSLSEHASRLNTAGETDFRAPGLEGDSDTSDLPSPSDVTSSDTPPTDANSDAPGTDSSTSADSA